MRYSHPSVISFDHLNPFEQNHESQIFQCYLYSPILRSLVIKRILLSHSTQGFCVDLKLFHFLPQVYSVLGCLS